MTFNFFLGQCHLPGKVYRQAQWRGAYGCKGANKLSFKTKIIFVQIFKSLLWKCVEFLRNLNLTNSDQYYNVKCIRVSVSNFSNSIQFQENINILFAQCCIALRGDHQIKLVNALQVYNSEGCFYDTILYTLAWNSPFPKCLMTCLIENTARVCIPCLFWTVMFVLKLPSLLMITTCKGWMKETAATAS